MLGAKVKWGWEVGGAAGGWVWWGGRGDGMGWMAWYWRSKVDDLAHMKRLKHSNCIDGRVDSKLVLFQQFPVRDRMPSLSDGSKSANLEQRASSLQISQSFERVLRWIFGFGLGVQKNNVFSDAMKAGMAL